MPIRTVGLTPEHRWCGALRSANPAVNNGKGAHGLVHGPNSLNATCIRPGRISDTTRKLAKNLRNGHLDQQIAVLNSGATYDQFQRVGHSLFALLSGLLGGTVAVWFYVRRERTDAAARE